MTEKSKRRWFAGAIGAVVLTTAGAWTLAPANAAGDNAAVPAVRSETVRGGEETRPAQRAPSQYLKETELRRSAPTGAQGNDEPIDNLLRRSGCSPRIVGQQTGLEAVCPWMVTSVMA